MKCIFMYILYISDINRFLNNKLFVLLYSNTSTLVLPNYHEVIPNVFSFTQIVKVFSEDGLGKVVEIPAGMTAGDLCQLLVYKSHCVDDNSWALVEHHPLLGLGRRQSPAGSERTHTQTHAHLHTYTQTQTCNTITGTHRCIDICTCARAGAYSHGGMHSPMSSCTFYAAYARTETSFICHCKKM